MLCTPTHYIPNLFHFCSSSWFLTLAVVHRRPEFMMFEVNRDDTEGLETEIKVSRLQ